MSIIPLEFFFVVVASGVLCSPFSLTTRINNNIIMVMKKTQNEKRREFDRIPTYQFMRDYDYGPRLYMGIYYSSNMYANGCWANERF